MNNKRILIFSLLFILALASFFRLWRLDSVPPGLYPDVAINGNDALDSLQTGNFKLFYPENNGREGVFMWLIAFSFVLLGPSVFAIKIVPAFFGILTVLGTYLLVKELFSNLKKKNENLNPEIIALISSFFLAISFWHVNFSRLGFRAILVPFSLVFAFYFLFLGFRKKKTYNFVLSGLFFAFGFYSYISYRFVVFMMAVALVSWWIYYKRQRLQKEFLRFAACCLLSTFIFALPIGIYFLKHPQDFFGRAAGVSIFSGGNILYKVGKSIVLHLGMFNFFGDANWRHNFAGSPQLLWPIGIFFLVGIILSLKWFVSAIRKKDIPECAVYGLLFSWFFFMLLSGILSYEGIPHALRVIGVIPVVYIFSGIGAYLCFYYLKKIYKTKKQTIAFGVVISIFLFSVAYAQFEKYFNQWGESQEVKDSFSENYVKVGEYLNSIPPGVKTYLIVNQDGVPVPWPNGIPMPAQTPMFIERTKFGQPRAIYLKPSDLDQISIEGKTIILPLQHDEKLLLEIEEKFPFGIFKEENGLIIYQAL
jgi:4-amino-4-deoxy-L-arabinose transferase-like glycosyltransferase